MCFFSYMFRDIKASHLTLKYCKYTYKKKNYCHLRLSLFILVLAEPKPNGKFFTQTPKCQSFQMTCPAHSILWSAGTQV